MSLAVLVISLTLVATASVLSAKLHRGAEQRLLGRQALQAGAVLTAAVGNVNAILAAARHVASPSEVLRWVHEAFRSRGTTTFCTVCFAVLTIDDEGPVNVALALGGPRPPLLCRPDGTSNEIGVIGTVLGIVEARPTGEAQQRRWASRLAPSRGRSRRRR